MVAPGAGTLAGGAAGSAAGGAAADYYGERFLRSQAGQATRNALAKGAQWIGDKTGHQNAGNAAAAAVNVAMAPDSEEETDARVKGNVATNALTGLIPGGAGGAAVKGAENLAAQGAERGALAAAEKYGAQALSTGKGALSSVAKGAEQLAGKVGGGVGSAISKGVNAAKGAASTVATAAEKGAGAVKNAAGAVKNVKGELQNTAKQGFDTLSQGAQKWAQRGATVGKGAKYGQTGADIVDTGLKGMDLYNQVQAMPNGPEIAQQLINTGAKGLEDPNVRKMMMGLAAGGAAAYAANKAKPGGVKGAIQGAVDQATGGGQQAPGTAPASQAPPPPTPGTQAPAAPQEKYLSRDAFRSQAKKGAYQPPKQVKPGQEQTPVHQPRQQQQQPPAATTAPPATTAPTAPAPTSNAGHSQSLAKAKATPKKSRRGNTKVKTARKLEEITTDEDAVIGKSLGSISGGALGSTLAGPIGGVIGSKLGGMAGEKLGGKLAQKTGRGRTEAPKSKGGLARHASGALGSVIGADIADIADAWHLSGSAGSEAGSQAGERVGDRLKRMMRRDREPTPALAEDIDLSRMKFLAGIRKDDN